MYSIREDTHKKSVFFSGRTTLMAQWSMLSGRTYTNGLVVHATLFFFSFLVLCLKQILTIFFLHNFWAKTAGFQRKSAFLLSGQGGFTLSDPTTKNIISFLFVSSLSFILPSAQHINMVTQLSADAEFRPRRLYLHTSHIPRGRELQIRGLL